MSEFKAGDVVRCIENAGLFYTRPGRDYTISDVSPQGNVQLAEAPESALYWFRPERFVLAGSAEPDPVNQPAHYTWLPNGVEVIDITKHLSFCLGNVVKYTLRADRKGNAIEDLKKAATYLRYEIERREEIARRETRV